jgi:hypothetical protein
MVARMRTRITHSLWSTLLSLVCASSACGGGGPAGQDAERPSDETGAGGATATGSGSGSSSGDGSLTAASSSSAGGSQAQAALDVHLVPAEGVSGVERVNFAIPLPSGLLVDPMLVRVSHEGTELATARRALAKYPDGSVRSVQVQLDLDVAGETDIAVEIGATSAAGEISLSPVAQTLVADDGSLGPRVWALLPASWLAPSGFAGPLDTEAEHAGTALAAWQSLCDYDSYDVDAFLSQKESGAVWLFDRGTVLYRGYARRGDLHTLSSAYRETAIYRAGLTGAGASLAVGVPGKASDLKYYYSQNLALHYLTTGDDRFRESAEQIAERMSQMWSPVYAPSAVLDGVERWTERHAGFYLLGQVWAMVVSDDLGSTFGSNADAAVGAYLQMQSSFPAGYDDPAARCFAHNAADHAEPYGYVGCSPWMSAILADALDAYAREREGAEPAPVARQALVALGRMIAEQGRDADGKPFYWMGVDTADNEIDEYDEHWGESAYIVAMARYHDGKQDAALTQAADELIAGLAQHGVAPHMRSFNWQCRSAVATPRLLQ